MNRISLLVVTALGGFRLNDFWSSIESAGNDILGKFQTIAPIAAGVCLALAGFAFMSGKRGADIAKPWIMYVIAGILLIFSALSLATWASGMSQF